MPSWVWAVIFVVVYLAIFTWVLPRAGVPT